jgi:hypothetical protein
VSDVPTSQPAESIRKLMEVADHTLYLKDNLVKYPVQRDDADGTLREAINNAWVRNNIACYLHVELEARGPNLYTHYLCIPIHKRVVGSRSKRNHIGDFAPETLEKLRKVGVPVGKHCYRGYHFVFVVVGELPETRQRVQEDVRLIEMASVGLMLINDCPVFSSELVERCGFLKLPFVGQPGRGTILDGKLDDVRVVWFLPPCADEAKLPDQVIEGGPEIVGYISDEDSDSADGIFRDGCCCPKYVIAAVRLVFKPHGYSVSIRDRGGGSEAGFAAKGIEMLFGPLDLSPDSGEVRLVTSGRQNGSVFRRVAHNCQNGDAMANSRSRRLVREGELSQTTDKGLEIPVPKRDEFFNALDKATKKNSDQEKTFEGGNTFILTIASNDRLDVSGRTLSVTLPGLPLPPLSAMSRTKTFGGVRVNLSFTRTV